MFTLSFFYMASYMCDKMEQVGKTTTGPELYDVFTRSQKNISHEMFADCFMLRYHSCQGLPTSLSP